MTKLEEPRFPNRNASRDYNPHEEFDKLEKTKRKIDDMYRK